MKKTLSVLLICLLGLTLFTACNKDVTEIKIGINYELSGEVATYGQSSVDGIELAIEQVNAAGGIGSLTVE